MAVDELVFRVLGPLEVLAAGRPVRIPGGKPRLLLATLLLDAPHAVPCDLLVEVLWPRRAPRSAQANVRTYVSALRALLGPLIRSEGSGYAIDVPAGGLDLLEFEALVGRARRQPELLREALALWRGAPLAGLQGSPHWERRLHPLAEVRLTAAQELAALRLAQGRYAEAVTELRALLADHPFREDLWRQLLLALHAGGRQAEALRAYVEVREHLVAELGVEPGPELRRAHAQVLTGEPAPHHSSSDMPVPRQLPPDIPDFVGRRRELAVLSSLPPLVVITGPPGSGKSALAVHAAHALGHAYPHGQLYLCLEGTSQAPADPAELLGEALRALGAVPAGSLPERVALYRSLLAERPMLVLLDDAVDAAQVRPLLPGGAGTVIVTSRRRITGLPGARRLNVDALDPAEAAELLDGIVGAHRTAEEPEEAAAILSACGHLPLAVRIAGARLAARPGWRLSVLRHRLADDSRRLGELRAGDLEVRASLEGSYRLLSADATRALATLGLLGSGDLPGWMVDAVLDRHRSDEVTDDLVDANLLQPVGTDTLGQPRYRLPDLVRWHALEQPPDTQALGRVLAAWTATTEHATARLPTVVFTLGSARAARWWPSRETLERLTADPLTWFEAEHDTLLGAVRLAAGAGLTESAWGLAAAMVPYFDLHCHFEAWQQTHRTALAAASAAGDRYGEAAMLRGLAQVCLYQDRYAESEQMFTRSRRIFRELGDTRGEATSICGLGAVSQFRGLHPSALAHFRQALAMFLSMGDQSGEAYTRQAIGRVLLKSGELAEASRWLDQALRLARELGDAHREGCVSVQVGRLHDLGSDSGRAMRFQGYALEIFQSLGDRHCGAYARQNLAGLQAARGDWAPATAGLERSLAVFRQLGDRSGEASATRMLGELHREAGRPHLARDYLDRASALLRSL
ncbi:tetratricopeptide repeat protein [Nonomuraea sp. NPDC046570]|uniref:AfsR/SARP family transcriptional regulator n=1 Tax=Nonomuraea sp. NPDC046570 TaxID=3155255 RepID=UPI0033CDC957